MSDDVVRQPPQNSEGGQVPQAPTETNASTQPAAQKDSAVPAAPKQASAKASKGSTRPIGVIVVAVVICTVLILGVVYAQITTTRTPNQSSSNQVSETQNQTQTGNTAAVDSVTKDAESLAESQQGAPTADLSDQVLGL